MHAFKIPLHGIDRIERVIYSSVNRQNRAFETADIIVRLHRHGNPAKE